MSKLNCEKRWNRLLWKTGGNLWKKVKIFVRKEKYLSEKKALPCRGRWYKHKQTPRPQCKSGKKKINKMQNWNIIQCCHTASSANYWNQILLCYWGPTRVDPIQGRRRQGKSLQTPTWPNICPHQKTEIFVVSKKLSLKYFLNNI